MQTLKDEEEQSTKKTAKVSLPGEIIEDIILKLPVKSILRFRSVSKPWLSRISHPSFTKLHLTLPHRTALFFSAYDKPTRKKHFLSASYEGGPVTHLMTLDDACFNETTVAQHLNGLLCFGCINKCSGFNYPDVFVVNPSTHHMFKLPQPDQPSLDMCYLFGFDESKNEHKILILNESYNSATLKIMIFSMSDYSWRNIYVEPPVGFDWDNLVRHYKYGYYYSVCVNSVVHLMLSESYDILGFDLRTEKFSVINTPQGVAPHVLVERWYFKEGKYLYKDNGPYFIKINGCIGVVCHDRVFEKNEMHIWILQDYENHVWIKEIITFPKCWFKLDEPFPVGSVNMDDIIFFKSKLFWNIANSVSIYNRKSRCFRDLQFTSGHQFPLSTPTLLNQIGGYVESMLPL